MMRANLISHPWILREKLHLPPASPMDAFRRLYGIRGLIRAYIINLKLVLENVAILVQNILTDNPKARIVITSDHGELLGENGKFGHGIEHPIVRVIPWFEVERCMKDVKDQSIARYEIVRERIIRKLTLIKKELKKK
jgi:hypothetical protein